jgi:adenine phosphoribosyltransferase
MKNISALPIISLETGIINENDKYYDITCCIIKTRLGFDTVWSEKFAHKNKYINQWIQTLNRENITVGSIICDILNSVNTHDWYFLINEYQSRLKILTNVIKRCIDYWYLQWKHNPFIKTESISFKDVNFIDIQHSLINYPCEISQAMSILTVDIIFDAVIAIDARGFLFIGEYARKGYPIIMARKENKLPQETLSITYDKEYGTDSLSITKNSIKEGSRIIVVDDVVATGGTMLAVEKLVKMANAEVINFIALFAITDCHNNLICHTDIIKKLRFYHTQEEASVTHQIFLK